MAGWFFVTFGARTSQHSTAGCPAPTLGSEGLRYGRQRPGEIAGRASGGSKSKDGGWCASRACNARANDAGIRLYRSSIHTAYAYSSHGVEYIARDSSTTL